MYPPPAHTHTAPVARTHRVQRRARRGRACVGARGASGRCRCMPPGEAGGRGRVAEGGPRLIVLHQRRVFIQRELLVRAHQRQLFVDVNRPAPHAARHARGAMAGGGHSAATVPLNARADRPSPPPTCPPMYPPRYNASVALAHEVAGAIAEDALRWPAEEIGTLLDGVRRPGVGRKVSCQAGTHAMHTRSQPSARSRRARRSL